MRFPLADRDRVPAYAERDALVPLTAKEQLGTLDTRAKRFALTSVGSLNLSVRKRQVRRRVRRAGSRRGR
jgi:hypothetical protein